MPRVSQQPSHSPDAEDLFHAGVPSTTAATALPDASCRSGPPALMVSSYARAARISTYPGRQRRARQMVVVRPRGPGLAVARVWGRKEATGVARAREEAQAVFLQTSAFSCPPPSPVSGGGPTHAHTHARTHAHTHARTTHARTHAHTHARTHAYTHKRDPILLTKGVLINMDYLTKGS